MKPFRLLSLFLCLCPLAVYAQTAEVGGAVRDPSAAVIPKASVEFRNQDTGVRRQTSTNAEGYYRIDGIDPGKYDATVQAQGFKTLTRENIVFHVSDKAQIDFKMQVGQTAQTVTVDASGLTMNTTDAAVSTVIDQKFVANLPLNGRSFQDLIDLTPGVVTQSPQQSGPHIGTNGDFSVNGQRTESSNYLVDGISANTNPGFGNGSTSAASSGSLGASTALGTTQSLLSVDALQEFRVESSTYSAEYGLSPGGQFSFITRSGTNTYHGNLFDYLRNNFFDANDWFNDHSGIAEPALRQNDFGGTVGGAVRIPGIYNGKNKSFFFFSYEALRLTQPTEATPGEYVPSTSLRTAAPNAIQPILNAFPLPTGAEIQIPCDNVTFQCPMGQPLGTLVPSGLAPFLRAYSLPSKIDSTSLRLDHQVNTRTHVFFRSAYTPSSTDTRTLSQLSSDASNQLTYTGGLNLQLSNSSTEELRVGYSRSLANSQAVLDNFGGAIPVNLSQTLGIAASRTAAINPYLGFNGVGSTSLITAYAANYARQWSIEESLSKTLGHHSIKVGASYRRITSSFAPESPYVSPYYASPASLLTNNADDFFYELSVAPKPVYNDFALFAQDELRVTPTLNLSFGVRWEVDPAPYSQNANKPYPLRGNVNDPSTFILGAPGAQLYNTTWGNVAPRLGAAWKVHNGRGAETVVRAGVGIFYDTGTSGTYNAFQSLGTYTYTEAENVALPVNPADYNPSFAVSPPYEDTVDAIAPNLRLPYTLQWSAAVEQGLGDKQNLTLSYVAANGKRLIKDNYINVAPVNPQFTYVSLFENGLTSNYQALQVQFQRQVTHGLQSLISYTWSHSLDFGSEDADYAYVRGNSNFDVRNVLNAALTWDLPWSKGNTVSKMMLCGWGLDGRVIARTAFPVALTGDGFYDPVTGSWQYAGLNLVPGVSLYTYSSLLPGGREINVNAFTSPPNGIAGDAPRNFARGFGEAQVNLAARREFPIREGVRLEFRAETFNIVNHPNFGYVDPNLSDATFGQATSTLANSLGTVSPLYQQGGARSMQFALKLIF